MRTRSIADVLISFAAPRPVEVTEENATPMPGAPMPGAPMPGAPMPGAPMPGAPMPGAAGCDGAARGAPREETAQQVAAPEVAIAAAHARGFAEGTESSASAHAAELDAERSRAEARLAAERSRWAEDEGRALADQLARGLAEIEARVAAQTARILRGFLEDRLIERATHELAEQVGALLSGAEGKVVVVSGPEDLLAALGEALGATVAAIDLRPGASAEVRITCGDTLVESRLSTWLARLNSAEE